MDAGADSADIINTTIEGPAGLTLTSGITGDIEFNGVVGANTAVGQVQINEARDVDVNQNFTSTGFNQATSGVGTFTVAADATLTTTTNPLTIDSETVTLNGNLRTNAGVDGGFVDQGQIVINAGTGGVTQAVDTTITSTSTTPGTASGAITISGAGDIALNGSVISTGADNNNGAGGDGGEITIDATGASTITVNGEITSSGGDATHNVNDGGDAGNIIFNTDDRNIVLTQATITAAGGANNGAAVPGNGGNVTFSDEVLLEAIGSSISTDATSGSIDFQDTIDGGQSQPHRRRRQHHLQCAGW